MSESIPIDEAMRKVAREVFVENSVEIRNVVINVLEERMSAIHNIAINAAVKIVTSKLINYPRSTEVGRIAKRVFHKEMVKKYKKWMRTETGRIISYPKNRPPENFNLFEYDFSEMEKRAASWMSYENWSSTEDRKLKREINAALSRIAVKHGRTLGAIISRMRQRIL